MFAKPQAEHQWLDQLVGNWDFEHHCRMPDGSDSITNGKVICRSLGGMWLIGESSGESAEGGSWTSIITLGFDPTQDQYVGTFVGSMMSHLWPYHGRVDSSGKRLPLASQGPKFDGTGVGQYRDTIEIVDANSWLLISELMDDNGHWVKFMEGRHVRSSSNVL